MDFDIYAASLMRAFGVLAVMGPYALGLVVSSPLLLYPIARWRAHREPVTDPQLGIKVALGYFAMLAFQLALAGAALLVFALLSKLPSEDRGGFYRLGFGLVLPAIIVFAAHVALLQRTNQERFPTVRRLFAGYNLVLTGLFGLTAFVMTFEALFMKGSSGDFGRFAGAALVVYGGAWAGCGIRFARLMFGASGAPPDLDSRAPTPVSPQPSGPMLPSLGGGSFPPLDPK